MKEKVSKNFIHAEINGTHVIALFFSIFSYAATNTRIARLYVFQLFKQIVLKQTLNVIVNIFWLH